MEARGRALLVGTSQEFKVHHTRAMREAGFTVEVATDLDDAVHLSAHDRPSVIIAEADSSNGGESLSLLKKVAPGVPLVEVPTGSSGIETIAVSTASGTQRVLAVPDIPALVAQLAALNVAEAAVARLTAENTKLRYEANIDQLTGVYNRRFLLDRLRHEWARSDRFSDTFSLLMLDLDNFKTLNDRYGHEVGDSVLVEVASFLAEAVRQVDTVARYGGDEFMILLVQAPSTAARGVGERLRNGLESLELKVLDDRTPKALTASFGCCGYPGVQPGDFRTLISCADRALYAAKHAGGNCVEIFSTTN